MTGHMRVEYRGPHDVRVFIDDHEVPGLVSVHVQKIKRDSLATVVLEVEPEAVEVLGPMEWSVTGIGADALAAAQNAVHEGICEALSQPESAGLGPHDDGVVHLCGTEWKAEAWDTPSGPAYVLTEKSWGQRFVGTGRTDALARVFAWAREMWEMGYHRDERYCLAPEFGEWLERLFGKVE